VGSVIHTPNGLLILLISTISPGRLESPAPLNKGSYNAQIRTRCRTVGALASNCLQSGAYPDPYTHQHAYANAHPNSDAHQHGYADANCHTDRNRHTDLDAY
jgi:hypothetical protein